MKKLNITKKQFTESKYFQDKYGKLDFVSESGNIYKTTKGKILKFVNEDKRQEPDFGAQSIEQASQKATGDQKQDLEIAMSALKDDNYEAFVADLNTMADKSNDDKIRNLRDAIVNMYNNGTVDVTFSGEEDKPIKNMRPTQFEVDMGKSLAFPLYKAPKGISAAFSNEAVEINHMPIVVADVGGQLFVIDGHHRWSQCYCLNPDCSMKVRIIKSDQLFGSDPDNVLKYVQMQIFVGRKGEHLPKATVDPGSNLYTADWNQFHDYCAKNGSEEAIQLLTQNVLAKFGSWEKALEGAKNIDSMSDAEKCWAYLWKNVQIMKKQAPQADSTHARPDMPQTDKAANPEEPMPAKAGVAPIAESKIINLQITKENYNKSRYLVNKYGSLKYVNESGEVFKTNKGKLVKLVK